MPKSKVAYVTIQRTFIVYDVDGLTEEQLKQKAEDRWNLEMELGDIMIHVDDITNIEIKEEE